jgi:hypothetical protein
MPEGDRSCSAVAPLNHHGKEGVVGSSPTEGFAGFAGKKGSGGMRRPFVWRNVGATHERGSDWTTGLRSSSESPPTGIGSCTGLTHVSSQHGVQVFETGTGRVPSPAEPDQHRRRELANCAAEGGWSVRALEAEIARGARAPSRPSQPHPDQLAAVAKLHDLVARATGCEMEARPHRLGYQLILDQNAVDRLAELL